MSKGTINGVLRVGLVQMHCDANPDVNLRRAIDSVNAAADRGAEIVCLPELFRSLYFCQTEDVVCFDLAETIPGPSTEALAAVAKKRKVAIIASLFENRGAEVFHNTAVLLDENGQIAGKYRKMHIPDDPSYYEKFYFTPGDLGFQAFECRQVPIGICVCWDQWFPESARLTALRGARILFYPTAIGWLPEEKETAGAEQLDAWQTVQRGHAIANGCYVCAVNRCGQEGGMEFWGHTFAADPLGKKIGELGDKIAGEFETLMVDCDMGRLADTRRIWPFFRDRRIDAYQGLDRRLIDQ